MLIALTRCRRDWPRTYRTYHQETTPPWRRAGRARVVRVGAWGLVIGRWTSQADGEDQALTDALGAREVQALDQDRHLLPHYEKDRA